MKLFAMTLISALIRLPLAVALSCVVLAAFILVQGLLLFPEHVDQLRNPSRTSIHRFMPLAGGNSALVLLRHHRHATLDHPRSAVGVLSVSDRGCFLRELPLDFAPFSACGARTGSWLFASSSEGRLYSFDLKSRVPTPRLLGSHGEGGVHDMECTADGSLVIASNRRIITAWRPDESGCLWRRDDLDIICACFLGQTSRLFCGVVNGGVHELDGCTGATVRTFPTSGLPVSMDISPNGKLLAILNHDGVLLVIDLKSGLPLWRKKLPSPAAGPRFSPDSHFLISPSERRGPTVQVLAATTGESVAELMGAKAEIAGIACSENGSVCAWDVSGTITAWSLSSRSLLRQFHVACLPPHVRSS
jgi:WD40 repeat protein